MKTKRIVSCLLLSAQTTIFLLPCFPAALALVNIRCSQNPVVSDQYTLLTRHCKHTTSTGTTTLMKKKKNRNKISLSSTADNTQEEMYDGGDDDGFGPLDYAITDSLSLPDDLRPTLWQSISNPRDLLALSLLLCGLAVARDNVIGDYSQQYQYWQMISVAFGFLSFIAAIIQVQTGYMVSPRPRKGVIDDAVMNLYAGFYSGCVSWLALRASNFCPSTLDRYDGIMSIISATVFAFSLAAPIITLVENEKTKSDFHENSKRDRIDSLSAGMTRLARFDRNLTIPSSLSENELFRTQGLLAIGVLGCIFVPDCIAFGIGSSDWWNRVTSIHPSQRILESSTALFALYATEASMIATRCADKGYRPYRLMVPLFAVVCLILAIIPCVCSLFWLGDDVSFFSFYRE